MSTKTVTIKAPPPICRAPLIEEARPLLLGYNFIAKPLKRGSNIPDIRSDRPMLAKTMTGLSVFNPNRINTKTAMSNINAMFIVAIWFSTYLAEIKVPIM